MDQVPKYLTVKSVSGNSRLKIVLLTNSYLVMNYFYELMNVMFQDLFFNSRTYFPLKHVCIK